MVAFNIYRSLSNPVFRLVRVANTMIWDDVAGALAATPTWADTAIALTANNYIAGLAVTIPAALPAGEYDFLVYDAASPAYDDEVIIGKRIRWSDSKQLLGLPIDL